MKIGFIKKRFNPYGGAENYLTTVMENLRGEGYELHLFCTDWKPVEGVEVHKIKNLSFTSAASVLSFDRNAARAVAQVRPDCVLSFERTTSGTVYRAGDGCHIEWLGIRRKVEGPLKALSFAVNPLHRALLGIERRIFESTPLIIANSEMVKRQIIEHYGTPEGRIRVVYNGVDTARFSPEAREEKRSEIRGRLGVPQEARVILFVGSGYERKGLGTVIEAMGRLGGESRLMVIGKGNIERFSKLANTHGVSDRVMFLGPQGGIEGFYATADAFVLPTLYDPFSNATIEAMASGLPIITSRNNGAAELIEAGEEGYVLDDMLSGEELSEKLSLVLADAEAMGRRARLKAERYPIQEAVIQYTEIIKQCLQ